MAKARKSFHVCDIHHLLVLDDSEPLHLGRCLMTTTLLLSAIWGLFALVGLMLMLAVIHVSLLAYQYGRFLVEKLITFLPSGSHRHRR